MLTNPEARGRVASASVRGDRLQLILGNPKVAAALPSEPRQNYLWFHGGRISFGRLTMTNSDLRLIDADRTDPFEFFAEQYNQQLVAGYSRSQPDGSLRTYMPDYGDLARGRSDRHPSVAHGAAVGYSRFDVVVRRFEEAYPNSRKVYVDGPQGVECRCARSRLVAANRRCACTTRADRMQSTFAPAFRSYVSPGSTHGAAVPVSHNSTMQGAAS